MKWLWDEYLGDAATSENRFASVLKNNFEHYPPTLIIASDEDPLRDDGRQLFEKMLTASVLLFLPQHTPRLFTTNIRRSSS